MNLRRIQAYLQEQGVDGWLLYNFRDLNPIAISVAGLQSGGSRRWFLWIPAQGEPRWLIHAIEGNMFLDIDPALAGEQIRYVSWQELAESLPRLIGISGRKPKILMEYSPGNAVLYQPLTPASWGRHTEHGRRDSEQRRRRQLALAVLTPEQPPATTARLSAAKDSAFDLIAERRAGQPIMGMSAAAHRRVFRQPRAGSRLFPSTPTPPIRTTCPAPSGPSPFAPAIVLIDLWCAAQQPRRQHGRPHLDGVLRQRSPAQGAAGIRDGHRRRTAPAYSEEQLAAGKTVHGYG